MKNIIFFKFLFLILISSSLEGNAQNNIETSHQIKSLIAKKRAFNEAYGYGFVIQIYYGNETKARSLRDKFKLEFPGVYTELDYDKPDWKVLVGRYKTKLEADKALIKFSEEFAGLIVIPLGK